MCSQPFSTLFLYVSQNSTPPDVDDRHYQLLFCCFSLIQKRRKVCVRHSFGDKSSSSSATLKFQWCLLRLSVNVGTTHLAASVVLLVPMWKNLMCYRFIANEDWRHHFLKCLSVEHSLSISRRVSVRRTFDNASDTVLMSVCQKFDSHSTLCVYRTFAMY